jgi:hypothetical protein
MRYSLFRKGLVFAVIAIFIATSSIQCIKGSFEKTDYVKILNNFQNKIPLLFPKNRNILKGNDEGPHENKLYTTQEWWYFNAYLNDENCELKNWFVLMSIQLYPSFCGSKLEIFDDKNKNYGGDDFDSLDKIIAYGPGVNIFFKKSGFEVGRYPNWHIYGKYNKTEPEIVVNLTFKANSLPMWFIKNTGNNRSNSIFGYYCVMDCSVYGNISFNGTFYNVSGVGYHDHTWSQVTRKKLLFNTNEKINNWQGNKKINLLNIWDWLCIHFNNGWDMFVGKTYPMGRSIFSRFTPGSLCFTASGIKFYETYFFLIDYLEINKSKIHGVEYPVKVRINALSLFTFRFKEFLGPIFFDFIYEAKNIREDVYEYPSGKIKGYFVSHGITYGSAKNLGITTPLDGWAVMETTIET